MVDNYWRTVKIKSFYINVEPHIINYFVYYKDLEGKFVKCLMTFSKLSLYAWKIFLKQKSKFCPLTPFDMNFITRSYDYQIFLVIHFLSPGSFLIIVYLFTGMIDIVIKKMFSH